MTAKLHLGFGNRITTVSSAGSFVAGCGAEKAGTPQPTDYARTTSTADVTFTGPFDNEYPITWLDLMGDNLDLDGRYQLKLFDDYAIEVYDSGDIPRWAIEPYGGIYGWPDATLGNPYQAMHRIPDGIEAQSFSLTLKNSTNPAGYLQLGSIWLSNHIEITSCLTNDGLESLIKEQKINNLSDSASDYSEVNRRWREQRLILATLSASEADTLHDAMFRYGSTGQLLFAPKVDDAAFVQRYGFVGSFRELTAIEYPYPRLRRLALNLKEIT